MTLRKKHINAIAMLASIVVCATTVQAAHTFTGAPHSVKMTAYKRANIYKGYSVTFKIDNLTQAWLDGKPCVVDEDTVNAVTFSQGFFQVVYYKRHGVAMLLQNGVFVGQLKP
ncbi:hypothetical protein ACI5CP_001597 [Cronobacter turicensis]|uniref:hypothetical protein n=1 Tax=Cronobacter turicensis TaxID=413502 RepID=UPI000CFD1B71|nr:hypothetical protein [Cronobacter turicensis]ELY4606008.1 hypothetical protein [Cronobacter turicensis]